MTTDTRCSERFGVTDIRCTREADHYGFHIGDDGDDDWQPLPNGYSVRSSPTSWLNAEDLTREDPEPPDPDGWVTAEQHLTQSFKRLMPDDDQ